ncbi:MAG: ABC transporter ATP-binding protein [Hyphomonadaceae bacterium]|nr:ABC transporter ATP-binding protein [Hyphomonadaceae bacterium]
MTAAAIAVTRVRRAYGDAPAVDDVTVTAPAGRTLALLGPSGSGKSTLLRMIAGLEPVDAGEIRIGGDRVSAPGFTLAPEARRIGMVFQDYALFPHLTAAGNVAFGLAGAAREAREAEALSWLDRVGLKRRAGAYPHELSGGEQQRVALARALAPQPRAVLLDEPFSGLDSTLRATLRDMTMAAIADAGATAVFVTHDIDEALAIADRLAVMHQGRLLQEDDPRTVYDHPNSVEAARALGPVNVIAALARGGAAETPFGAVSAAGLSGAVSVAVRAEALQLVPGGRALVTARRPQGAFDAAWIEAGGVTWRAAIPNRGGPEPGARADVRIDPAGAFVFARKDGSV